MNQDINTQMSGNVIYQPDLSKVTWEVAERQDEFNNNPQASIMNRSSMMTYSKIVCCICSAVIEANSKGMCSACERSSYNILDGITKEGLMHYCKLCDRYLRPPWVKAALESPEMMTLCLAKIKGLNKVKLVDTSFIWTEPHSKIIKIKLTVQKEINKSVIETNFIVEFKVEWTQCDDCKKTFTPHIWNSACQIRQKVTHKRTFMYLEQMILKHKAHSKALNVKEHPEGVDFYFSSKSQACALNDFILGVLPAKTKQSKQLISHDQHSNLYNYKYTYMIEIAPVCKEDLIVLDKETCKALGGIGPVLLCHKVSSRIHLIDPLTFEIFDFDGNTYWRHDFRSYIDRSCLTEFLVINVDEEIDYHQKYAGVPSKNSGVAMEIESDTSNFSKNNQSKSTNYRKNATVITNQGHNKKKQFKIVTVQCIRNNNKNEGNMNLISARTHLGKKVRPGDIFYGYDLTEINLSTALDEFLRDKQGNIPEIILVKKKYQNHKRIFKLKHIDKEEDAEMKERGNKKNHYDKEAQYEEFLKDIQEDKDMRKNINMYKDDEAIKLLEKKFDGLKVKEDVDSDTEINVNDLLDELTINDEANNNSIEQVKQEDEDEDFQKPQKGKKSQLGKRERGGKKIDESF